jgi:GAF domain-containing protein
MNAPKPANEKQRLEVLWRYDLLDTPPDETLDDLTQLAAYVCRSPIALISLVDENRQWFKSRLGLTMTETARDISFCSHAILQRDVMVVPDAMKDARFASNPLVTAEPHIRFYAGAPLVTGDGHALGTLCVIDYQPRRMAEDQLEALRRLARVVMHELELRQQVREFARVPVRQKKGEK